VLQLLKVERLPCFCQCNVIGWQILINMFNLNKELLDITRMQIVSDLQDLDCFSYERIENFKKFIQNHSNSKDDLISIFSGVHQYKQEKQFDFITAPKKSKTKIDLEYKIEIIEMYYDSVRHFIACL
jgi:hypothetical protein